MKKTIAILLILFFSISIKSQVTVSGKVIDLSSKIETQAILPGASIIVNSTTGTISNLDGDFTIKVPSGKQTITCKFIRFKTLEQIIEFDDKYKYQLEIKLVPNKLKYRNENSSITIKKTLK